MSASSKRTYEAVAKAIKDNTSFYAAIDMSVVDRDRLVSALADYFEQDNEHFDRDRFVKACGSEG
jgi:hypothetical protein